MIRDTLPYGLNYAPSRLSMVAVNATRRTTRQILVFASGRGETFSVLFIVLTSPLTEILQLASRRYCWAGPPVMARDPPSCKRHWQFAPASVKS